MNKNVEKAITEGNDKKPKLNKFINNRNTSIDSKLTKNTNYKI